MNKTLFVVAIIAIASASSLKAIGLQKNSDALCASLAEHMNDIISNVKYIILYDYQIEKGGFPNKQVTKIKNIEVKDLAISTPLSKDDVKATITQGKTALLAFDVPKDIVQGNLSFDWEFRMNGMKLYEGSYTATVKSTDFSFTETFTQGSTTIDVAMNIPFAVSNEKWIASFPSDEVEKIIKDSFPTKILGQISEEFTRYKDIFEQFAIGLADYKEIEIQSDYLLNSEKLVIRNTLESINIEKDIIFGYNSQLVLLKSGTIISDFTTFSTGDTDLPFTVYFPNDMVSKGFSLVAELMPEVEIPSNFTKKDFGFDMKIEYLSDYIPALADNFPETADVNLTCHFGENSIKPLETSIYSACPNCGFFVDGTLQFNLTVNITLKMSPITTKYTVENYSLPFQISEIAYYSATFSDSQYDVEGSAKFAFDNFMSTLISSHASATINAATLLLEFPNDKTKIQEVSQADNKISFSYSFTSDTEIDLE